jgi:two-component system sensor histidine kinase TctE
LGIGSINRRAEAAQASVRTRLLRLLLMPLLTLLALSVWTDYHTAIEPALTAYDQALADAAIAVGAHVRSADHRVSLDLPPQAVAVLRTDRYDKIYYRLSNVDGSFAAGDSELPAVRASVGQNPQFVDAQYRGEPVRMVIYRMTTPDGEATVEVAETMRKREQLAHNIMLAVWLPNATLIIATLILVYFGVRVGLSPLGRLRKEIETRSPTDLSPLPQTGVPEEVRALVGSLNRLLRMLRESTEAQKRFLADAAHQMRTPLAGLQTQLELIPPQSLPEEVRPRLALSREATRRLAHMAHQLLALARAEPSANLAHALQRMDLREVVENAASTHLDRAIAKNIDIGFEAQDAPVNGSKWLLREAADNLIDNALAYTPSGGRITVRSGTNGQCAFFEVEDDGPGIAPSERAKVLDRFYRVPGSTGEGCGLGLAIVKEIADLHAAKVVIDSGERLIGTRVRLTFPPAASAPGRAEAGTPAGRTASAPMH